MATFTLTYSYESGDSIAIWGHSIGVTTEDYENDPSIDPYFIHQEFTATESESAAAVFTYDPARGYVASIYVNGVLVNSRTIDAIVDNPPQIESVSPSYRSITVWIGNASTSDSISIYYFSGSTKIYGSVYFYSGNRASASIDGLSPGVSYTLYVVINGSTSQIVQSTLSYPVFEWDSDVSAGAQIPFDNTEKKAAPVTAAEWNRLVGYVNLKCGTSIGNVSQGEEMNLYEGGNVWRVAQALGVAVTPKSAVTAKFFNDLRDRYNSK